MKSLWGLGPFDPQSPVLALRRTTLRLQRIVVLTLLRCIAQLCVVLCIVVGVGKTIVQARNWTRRSDQAAQET